MALLGLALLVAVLDWLALRQGWHRMDYLVKPGVMLALILAVARFVGQDRTGLLLLLAAGLSFSLLGDVLLMLPRERFVEGLAAFLLAHVAYILALNRNAPSINGAAVVLALVGAGAAWWLFGRILAALQASGQARLRAPVLVYGVVLTLMLLSALLTLWREDWNQSAAFLTALGALLFYLSDALLAWERFIRRLRLGRLGRRMIYHLGQISLTAGVLLQFLSFN